MSAIRNPIPRVVFARPTYRSSVAQLAEPFVDEMLGVFRQLESLTHDGNTPPGGPPNDTIEWAKEVLLRILPRKFLISAEIDAFQSEIHATWENDESGKS